MQQSIVTLSKEGRVVIPAELRQQLGVVAGDSLSVRVEDGEIVLSTKAILLKRLREVAGSPPRGELVSEQLIQERREEASKE